MKVLKKNLNSLSMLTDGEYNKLINKKSIVVVYFYSIEIDNFNINIDKFKKKYENNFILVDILENIELIKTLNVKSAPLFRIYKNGDLIEEIFGTYKNINDILKPYLV